MFKAILLGLLASVLVLPIFGLAAAQFLPPNFVPVGAPGWKQQHDQLVSIHSVQWLTLLNWTTAAALGGYVSSRIHTHAGLRPAIWVGAIILLVWGIPTGVILDSKISWVHLSSCLLIMPAVLLGGRLAQSKTAPNLQTS